MRLLLDQAVYRPIALVQPVGEVGILELERSIRCEKCKQKDYNARRILVADWPRARWPESTPRRWHSDGSEGDLAG